MNNNLLVRFALLIVCGVCCGLTARAVEPVIWKTNSRAEILRGNARSVSITDDGKIILAPRLVEVFNTQQSFVWSSATDEAGNVYLGTGSDGKVFKVDAGGKGSLFADFNELDVTALEIGKDNAVYAATSPDGKVYRVDQSGKAEVYFDPSDKYIWSLKFLSDNSLIVGTGENGKIYRVRAANANPDASLLFDSSETHIISLAADKQGNVLAGTDAGGIVLRISPAGKAFALLDASAPLREIHDLAVGADNSIYVLALSDSASASGSSNAGAAAASGASVATPAGATATVTINGAAGGDDSNVTPVPTRSRNDLSNVKSAVFRILPDGTNQVLWSSATVTGFALEANPTGNGVFLGTSDKGRIYSITNDARETLLLQTNEGQISNLKARANQIFAASSNGGKLYRFSPNTAADEGLFESEVRDAKTTALWGQIAWQSNGNVELQTRTGNTDKPDQTWSDWSAAYRTATGAQIVSPRARFCQWRAILRGGAGGGAVNLNEVTVSYLAQNLPPEITSLQVLPNNVGLQANPLPPSDPNVENSGLEPAAFGLPPVITAQPRRLYQRAARALQWTAEDRNGDKLVYAVYYRAQNETVFRLLKDNLRENFYTIDGAALTDGRYVFKITASDSPSNPLGQSLTAERTSEVVEIDNTPPTITIAAAPTVTNDRARVTFEVADAASFVRRAEVSFDAKEWQPIYADDGVTDGRRETYTIETTIPPGEHTILLRAFDANGNSSSQRVNVRR